MSVPELLKTPLPTAAAEGIAPAVTTAAVSTMVTASGTPLRGRSTTLTSGTPIANPANSNDKAEANAPAATPATAAKGKVLPKTPEEFYKDLQQFHERRGTPILQVPKISGREVDLHLLYSEVTERGGFAKVNQRDEWDEVLPAVGMRDKCVNATAGIKHIYRRCLEKYERLNFLGEDPDKMELLEASDNMEGGRSRARYPSTAYSSTSNVNAVPMSYNYRQHIVNMDRRRMYRLSTDLYKASQYEKLMLSLISPLPNEQDFAINVCTLMTNENKHTLKLNEFPKLLDVLLAHTGVFADYTLRKLFQHVYTEVRQHSLYAFWRDLLHDKPQILELYTEEQVLRDAGLIDDDDVQMTDVSRQSLVDECLSLDFLNLGRGEGTQEYVGQRVQQVVSILRNLSFFDENLPVFAKNRTFARFVVMSANIRWGNIHNQALDIAGNMAAEWELADPTTDELTRCLLATLCDGIEGLDRGVIINCLEILYKLCQKDSNEDYINKCLNLKFYETLCLFLSLNDIMLLIFTLEAIYALTSMGARSCHLIMQVRGIIDQLVSLITVEAQSYGPDGCILMRVVETVPGNMLPMVAQNIANLQNVAVIQKQQQHTQHLQPQAQPQPIQPVATTTVQLHLPQPQPQPQPQTQTQPQQQPQSQPQVQTSHEQPQQQQHIATTDSQSAQTQPPHPQVVQHVNTQSQQQQQQQQQLPQQPAPQPTLQMPQNYTHEDEQYALAWLGATFERAASVDSHVEQQELYRMYLSHCQKSGKHSVVNHLQFPRLVRLIFNNSVGPVTVRHADGTELPGYHYVAIRIRAQPLPIQTKPTQTSQKNAGGEVSGSPSSLRKVKKKGKESEVMPAATKPCGTVTTTTAAASSVTAVTGCNDNGNTEVHAAVIPTTADNQVGHIVQAATSGNAVRTEEQQPKLSTQPMLAAIDPTTAQQQPSSSVIKSLLATKVTQRQQKQKELTVAATTQTNTQTNVLASGISSSTPTTMQQVTPQPIKVTSTAISALVNNQLMQNTPLKVGQTTIKPLNPQNTLEKKPIIDSAPPPLAPLSGSNVVKDTSGRPVIIANQMLVEILDKKGVDPPLPSNIIKRKMEESGGSVANESSMKRLAVEATKESTVTPSKNAANLYAEMAASILEDEELDDIPPMPGQQQPTTTDNNGLQQSIIVPAKIQQAPLQSVQNVQRQLVFQSNQSPQLKLAGSNTQQIPTAMATIKTDQGLQTVPVILQQKTLEQTSSQQLIQQVIQQNTPQTQPQQQTTQYVLATNPQGQTYLVAQQSQPPPQQPPPTQTVLVTQTPQQQSAGTKTIIILQQQTQPHQLPHQQQQIITAGGAVGTQKMIMTTPQGQQVLLTQRTQPSLSGQQQIFINPQTGAATHIQHVPVSGVSTTSSNQLLQRHQFHTTQASSMQQQAQTGQISPSLLSQLNHIPATIKLHQPQMPPVTVQQQPQPQQHQPATISRLGKTVSIVQATSGLPPPPPIAIPQLQQHQSIIQQHIISGPTEKRQVILGGRAIEIKETVITQAAPPPQQSQLNSQTIITKQILPQQPPQTQQQQQQIRAVIEQQQQHPSIIQQKITIPIPQQQQAQAQQQQQQQQLLTQKSAEHTSVLPTKSQTVVKTVLAQPVTSQATLSTIKKPTVQHVVAQVKTHQQQQATPTKPQLPTVNTANNKPIANEPPPLTPTTIANPAILQQQQQQQKELSKQIENTISNVSAATATTSVSTVTSTATTSTVTAAATPRPSTPRPATPQATPTQSPQSQSPVTTPMQSQQSQPTPMIEANWLYVCDWRNCPRRKFKSVNDLQHHVCSVHCPDHLDPAAEIFCQWGPGPSLCDGIPRKRFSLMTHIIDRHLTQDSLRAAMQRRVATGTTNLQPTQPPVTIVRNIEQSQRSSTASPALSNSSSSSLTTTGSSAIHAIKRHTADFVNPKELMDENEGPVTKSIRLTAALILRNLVTYTSNAKRMLRRYEPHLANVALSNVESSGAISHILFELNN